MCSCDSSKSPFEKNSNIAVKRRTSTPTSRMKITTTSAENTKAHFPLQLSYSMMILCFSVFNICILQSVYTNFHHYNDLSFLDVVTDPQRGGSSIPRTAVRSTLLRPEEQVVAKSTPQGGERKSSSSYPPTVLVTGGCGYIGSHTIVLLLQEGYNVVVVDNLVNSSPVSLDRVAIIVGLTPEERKERLHFYSVDICNESEFREVFVKHPPFHAVVHFAGLKAVGESTQMPLRYYENNLIGSFILLRLMDEYGCHALVFSSSATVYGHVERMPLTEDTPTGTGITNAYGRTKHMIEQVLQDFYHAKTLDSSNTTDWKITILRYFNPVGAHPSGLIGEDPNGIPNNLMPFVAQVAVGRREYVIVHGNDYDTVDGTGVRDYIHVMDLSEGHVSALHYMDRKTSGGIFVFNLGTGNGYSVLQMCQAMREVSGHEIPYKIGPRRSGDIATCYADPTKAAVEMGWKAQRNLKEMCQDLWNWQSKNPNGYVVESSSR